VSLVSIGTEYVVFDDLALAIDSLKNLRAGWKFGRGNAISPKARNVALRLNSVAALFGFKKKVVFPLDGGGIDLAFRSEMGSLEFSISSDGEIEYFENREESDEPVEGIVANLTEASQKLGEFLDQWSTSASYTFPNSTQSWGDFVAHVSAPLATDPVFRSYSRPVLSRRANQYVAMVDAITAPQEESRASRLFTFPSTRYDSSLTIQSLPTRKTTFVTSI
jgi:hypothetical protein